MSVTGGPVPVATWSWGQGPTVVLVHGWSGSAGDLQTIAAALADAGFRVLLADMPAHGRSAGRRTSLAQWVEVLRSLEHTHGPFHAVIGHSLGAAAVTLALAGGMKASAAVLIAPPADPLYFLRRLVQFLELPRRYVQPIAEQVVQVVGRDFADVDAGRAARTLTLPAVIMHDPHDDVVPWSHAQTIASVWRGSRVVAREEVGHYRILRDRSTIGEIIGFLSNIASSLYQAG